ncbi:MAG: c-type cytochrome domain-containing protein, partial [Planctomycetia bacterium]
MPVAAQFRCRRLDRGPCSGRVIVGLAVFLLGATQLPDGPPAHAAEANARELEQLFESRVRPLFVAKCQRCHGDKVSEAGLRLDSRRAVLTGGDSGEGSSPAAAIAPPTNRSMADSDQAARRP